MPETECPHCGAEMPDMVYEDRISGMIVGCDRCLKWVAIDECPFCGEKDTEGYTDGNSIVGCDCCLTPKDVWGVA